MHFLFKKFFIHKFYPQPLSGQERSNTLYTSEAEENSRQNNKKQKIALL